MKQLNSALSTDPDHPIPDKYKRVLEKNLKLSYTMSLGGQKGISEGYLYGYQVINDLFNSLFK